MIGGGVGGLTAAIRLQVGRPRGHDRRAQSRRRRQARRVRARRVHLRCRPVAGDPAARVRRGLPPGGNIARRAGHDGAARSAVQVLVARRIRAGRARRPGRDGCRVRGVRTRRRGPVARVRCQRPDDLGRLRTDILRRPDVEPGVAARSEWSRRAICSTSTRSGRSAGRRATPSTTTTFGSGPAATPPTRARRPRRLRQRSRASRTSSHASAAGIRWADSARSAHAFEKVALDVGVEIRTSTEVMSISSTPDRVTGVELDDGTPSRCPDRRRERRRSTPLRRPAPRPCRGEAGPQGTAARRAASCCASVFAGRPPASATTTSGSPTTRIRSSGRSTPADSPMIRRSTAACRRPPIPRQAPDGDENWFLLVNTPPGIDIDAERYRDLVLERLATHGVDLRRRMRFCAHMTPSRHRAQLPLTRRRRSTARRPTGNGRRLPGRRTEAAKPGLYLVGGSSHPGGGLPLVTTSGRIVADMIADDFA